MALTLFLSILVIFAAAFASQPQRQRVYAVHTSLIALADFRLAVDEAQAGVDDYVMSGGASGAQLYQDAQAHVRGDARLLLTLRDISASADARSDLAQIQRLTSTYLDDLRHAIALEQGGQTAQAMRWLSVGPVQRDVHTLRDIITRLQATINDLLRSQGVSDDDTQRLLTVVFIVTTLIDLISFAAILILIRRTVTLREQFAQERGRAEEQARAAALEETNRRMTEFLGAASHEIRTPLTSLKIGLQLAAREVRQTSVGAPVGDGAAGLASLESLLDRALASTANLERLTADLVDATRIETSALMMRPTTQSLAALIADCVAEQRLYHPGRAITLDMAAGDAMATMDADRIRQVITNYLINALKFSDEERPVAVRLSMDGDHAMVRVRDEGPGIPAEERERIWDRFYRAPGIAHKTGSSEGFGLGLYIARSIIERHGGAVGVESELGQGSTFWFTLPLASAPNAPPASPAGPGAATHDSPHPPRG
jgi:signal transduction histidine kinase